MIEVWEQDLRICRKKVGHISNRPQRCEFPDCYAMGELHVHPKGLKDQPVTLSSKKPVYTCSVHTGTLKSRDHRFINPEQHWVRAEDQPAPYKAFQIQRYHWFCIPHHEKWHRLLCEQFS